MFNPEYKSFLREVHGNEGSKCAYNMRLDTYGCGCEHDCSYCYAKSLLSFRNLWNSEAPSVADIKKIKRKISKIPASTVIRLGGMTDCFQRTSEIKHRVTYETIQALNQQRLEYLIVTKSDLVAAPEYLAILDKRLAHIQISVSCLDDVQSATYEKAVPPSKRIEAIQILQEAGYDVAIRLSPILNEYMDYELLNSLQIHKCIVEFLRVNTWIRNWFGELDFSRHTLRHSNYYHLQLDDKIEIVKKIKIPEISVCEDVTEHYLYWQKHLNCNQADCCNLRRDYAE